MPLTSSEWYSLKEAQTTILSAIQDAKNKIGALRKLFADLYTKYGDTWLDTCRRNLDTQLAPLDEVMTYLSETITPTIDKNQPPPTPLSSAEKTSIERYITTHKTDITKTITTIASRNIPATTNLKNALTQLDEAIKNIKAY